MSEPTPKVQNLFADFQSLDDEERRQFYTLSMNPPEDLQMFEGIQPIKTRWTIEELAKAEFAPPRWAVPGIVPVGLSSLAGRPKLGKSWLALQIAVAVGCGGRLFDLKIDPGKVLYLALEDSPRG